MTLWARKAIINHAESNGIGNTVRALKMSDGWRGFTELHNVFLQLSFLDFGTTAMRGYLFLPRLKFSGRLRRDGKIKKSKTPLRMTFVKISPTGSNSQWHLRLLFRVWSENSNDNTDEKTLQILHCKKLKKSVVSTTLHNRCLTHTGKTDKHVKIRINNWRLTVNVKHT